MTRSREARLPPRWFIVAFWHGHRALLRATHGRCGLWRPKAGGWGALRLTTTGRRSGEPRQVVVGYIEDGPNLVTMAMNGWAVAEPAWWLNLQQDPRAVVQTRDGTHAVSARRAEGEERARLWSRWTEVDEHLDEYAARRPSETAVVVLEPRGADGQASEPLPGSTARGSAHGPGHVFADHPRVYWLSLAGAGGACAYALVRAVRAPDRRRGWVALALLESAIAMGIVRARSSAVR